MQPYEELEIKYAEHVQTDHACVVNTGTAALHLALEALELPKNIRWRVIVPDFTMYASGLAVHYAGMQPIFVDCDDNLLINLDEVERLLLANENFNDIRVLMVTHVYGRIVDMDRVMSLAKRFNLRVIEDACEAQGAYYGSKPIGSFDIGCFSFYRNKIIHAEEGGIITSNDKKLIDNARDMRSMSFGDTHDYYHKRIGFNYRCTNSQAEMALESLANVEYNLKRRQEICNIYNAIVQEKYQMPDNRKAVWVYDMWHPNANEIVHKLKAKGIPARHSFKPMSMQPLFSYTLINKNALEKSKNVFYINVDPHNPYDPKDIIMSVIDEF